MLQSADPATADQASKLTRVEIDRELVCRLEASAAEAALAHVLSLSTLKSESVATGVAFGDGALIATGPGRYVNRGVGVTLTDLTEADFDEIESFYFDRGLDASLELCSWAPESTVVELSRRGYGLAWFRAMYAKSVPDTAVTVSAEFRVEPVDDSNVETWLEVLALGNGVSGDEDRAICDDFGLAGLGLESDHSFLAYVDGHAAGCGSVQGVNRVAWLGPAATIPEFRSRGVQSALIHYRTNLARQLGCDLVAATAVPSDTSARNLMRHGFEATHTQIVMTKTRPV